VQFSRDGRYAAVVIKPTTVEIWNMISGSLHKRIPLHAPILALYFDNSADSLVTLTRDGTVAVWDTAHGTPLFSYKEVDLLTAATFSSDGLFLAVARWNGTSGTIKVWEVKPWRAQAFLNKTPHVHCMAFHPGKSELVIGYQHGKVRIWNVLYEELGIYKHMQASLQSIAFSPGGTYLALASKAGELVVLETDSWNPLLDVQDNSCVHTLLFSPQGNYLVAGCDDGKVKIWEMPAVRELPPLVHMWPVRAMTWSFDSTYLVTTGKGLTASIWDIHTRQEVMRLTHDKDICRMAFSMHGHYLFTAGHDRSIRVWEVIKSRHRIQSIQQKFVQEDRSHAVDNIASITPMSEFIKEHVNTNFYSPDRQYVARAEDNDIVGIWNAVDGTHVTNLPYGGKNSTIAFSPDGAYLAIGSSGRDLRIWETNTGQHIACFSHTANIRKLLFSSDGRHLTVECCDGTVTIWLWRPEDMLKEVSRYVTHGLSEEEWKRYIGDRPYHPEFHLA
jgi:WD40 repeat protein